MDDETPVAWTAMPYRAPVVDAAGNEIGTAESLMGDEAEDIFHGLAVKLKHSGRLVEITAAQIGRVTNQRVNTTIPPEQIAQLPDYQQERWFHLGWGGLFRKHPMWTKGA
jgi:hypothetical protein